MTLAGGLDAVVDGLRDALRESLAGIVFQDEAD
jgi:hypothetical protein